MLKKEIYSLFFYFLVGRVPSRHKSWKRLLSLHLSTRVTLSNKIQP